MYMCTAETPRTETHRGADVVVERVAVTGGTAVTVQREAVWAVLVAGGRAAA